MARMRRINIVIDAELDDRLESEAAVRGMSKSALVRELVGRGLPGSSTETGLLQLLELAQANADVEPVDDLDTYLYGPVGTDP